MLPYETFGKTETAVSHLIERNRCPITYKGDVKTSKNPWCYNKIIDISGRYML